MKISDTMNLSELRERMGESATTAEAKHMRAALDGLGAWSDTKDVPEKTWHELVEAAVAQAKWDE